MASIKPTSAEPSKTATKATPKTTKPVEKSMEKTETVASKASINVVDLTGKVTGKLTLPAEIFASKINKPLMAQAVRVYLANQRQGNASTKTRGEVVGSTRKIYRQKGTGRARHGAAKAPIFVHGGIAHGPKPHDFGLSLPQKMKRAALFSALTAKLQAGQIVVVDGLSSVEVKTKAMATAVKHITPDAKVNTLVIVADPKQPFVRAIKNIDRVSSVPATLLTTYTVLTTGHVILMKEAVDVMKTHFLKGAQK